MFDKIKNIFKKSPPVEETVKIAEPNPKKPRKPRKPKKEMVLSAKEQATLAGEPYIAILSVEVDPNNVGNGSFDLDWNEKFVVNLIKQGYKIKQTDTDAEIVDRWFQTVCRNVALEIYEQDQADPTNRDPVDMRIIRSRDLGNGRTEVS
jgi:hypothetical protein